MSNKTDAIKKALVALGHGSSVTDYSSNTVSGVLKELAVILECAKSVEEIRTNSIADILCYIADNYGSEEHEPYNLTSTPTHATVTIKRNNKAINPGSDILYNGDKLKITATADEGYELTTLTVNGEDIESGDTITVNGHNIAIVATGTLKTFNLARTATECTIAVTKGGSTLADGSDVLSYGDEITITATASDTKVMSSLKVNGEDFVSGETLTVTEDVEIVGVAE